MNDHMLELAQWRRQTAEMYATCPLALAGVPGELMASAALSTFL